MSRSTRKADRILIRFARTDSPAGISRPTLKVLARTLECSEHQAIHRALRKLADHTLPYPADDGPLTQRQLKAIRRLEPQGRIKTMKPLFS